MKKAFFKVAFTELFTRSWWVWAASIVCFGLYEQGVYRIAKEEKQLEQQIDATKEKYTASMHTQHELQIQLASLSDPLWIERSLIQNLGLVPEGYTKVVFEETR